MSGAEHTQGQGLSQWGEMGYLVTSLGRGILGSNASSEYLFPLKLVVQGSFPPALVESEVAGSTRTKPRLEGTEGRDNELHLLKINCRFIGFPIDKLTCTPSTRSTTESHLHSRELHDRVPTC